MQLYLEADELNLLADVLLEESVQSPSEKSRSDELLNKVLGRDLRLDTDELEHVGDVIGRCERALKDEIARTPDSTQRDKLRRRWALAQRVLERVNEACAMF